VARSTAWPRLDLLLCPNRPHMLFRHPFLTLFPYYKGGPKLLPRPGLHLLSSPGFRQIPFSETGLSAHHLHTDRTYRTGRLNSKASNPCLEISRGVPPGYGSLCQKVYLKQGLCWSGLSEALGTSTMRILPPVGCYKRQRSLSNPFPFSACSWAPGCTSTGSS